MINIRPIIKRIKSKGWWDLDNASTFCEGVFIYHTKKNPNRKVLIGLSADGIENRERHCKARWPIRWFLQEEVYDYWIKYIRNPIVWRSEKVADWCRYTFVKRHQYHLIRPRTLQKGYHEPEERMLHGMFEILTKYCEIEKDRVSWDDEEWNEEFQEGQRPSEVNATLNELNEWWNVTRPARVEPEGPERPEGWGFMAMFRAKNKDHPYLKELDEWGKLTDKLEKEWREEDTKMMIKLIEVRHWMWS
jgi:hypothetical protein